MDAESCGFSWEMRNGKMIQKRVSVPSAGLRNAPENLFEILDDYVTKDTKGPDAFPGQPSRISVNLELREPIDIQRIMGIRRQIRNACNLFNNFDVPSHTQETFADAYDLIVGIEALKRPEA